MGGRPTGAGLPAPDAGPPQAASARISAIGLAFEAYARQPPPMSAEPARR
jgi:hypothetical protein